MNLLIPTRRSSAYGSSPLDNLSRELDRLFESPPNAQGQRECPGTFAPALELREDKENVSVSVELPGVDRNDVEVTLHEGVLTITGERKQPAEVKEGEYFRSERRYGRFQRQVTIPPTSQPRRHQGRLQGRRAYHHDSEGRRGQAQADQHQRELSWFRRPPSPRAPPDGTRGFLFLTAPGRRNFTTSRELE